MSTPTAFITGITGQDGFYLTQLLLKKKYRVVGISQSPRTGPFLTDLRPTTGANLVIASGTICDQTLIRATLERYHPDELYNLAGITDLEKSEQDPRKTMEINYRAVGTLFTLALANNPGIRIFQALSAEMLDKSARPQSENTPFKTVNIYGLAKLQSYEKFVLELRRRGAHISAGFLFNHESPRRDACFVTRKITRTMARISRDPGEVLELGNLEAHRDWSFAGDFVEAMWLMLQKDAPDDYILASGMIHTVREFAEEAGRVAGIAITWQGKGINQIGLNSAGKVVVKVNPKLYRPEIDYPLGDISKARTQLGWKPKVSFKELVAMMMMADLANQN